MPVLFGNNELKALDIASGAAPAKVPEGDSGDELHECCEADFGDPKQKAAGVGNAPPVGDKLPDDWAARPQGEGLGNGLAGDKLPVGWAARA